MATNFKKFQKRVAPYKGRKTYGGGLRINSGSKPSFKVKLFGGLMSGFWNWAKFDRKGKNHFKSRRLF